jgi:ankyrin repeat protein
MGWLRDAVMQVTKPKLVQAAKRGDLNEVRRLLEAGAGVDVSDRYGRTALMEASREGHIDIVRLLLEKGADVFRESFGGTSALQYAKMKEVWDVLAEHMTNAESPRPRQ